MDLVVIPKEKVDRLQPPQAECVPLSHSGPRMFTQDERRTRAEEHRLEHRLDEEHDPFRAPPSRGARRSEQTTAGGVIEETQGDVEASSARHEE